MAYASLPLFPLHEVLLPGAAMDLRIFERRSLDVVRDCGRSASGFGVCLILEGDEAGAPAIPAAYGVEARIENFDLGEDGLLSLRVRGHRRFHVVRTRVRNNGLVMADVEWRCADEDGEIRPEHALLGTLLQTMINALLSADADAVVGARFAQLRVVQRERCGGDATGVERVGLADAAVGAGVHARGLDDGVSAIRCGARQACSVGSGALDHPEHAGVAAGA